jgi:hypothetical protein
MPLTQMALWSELVSGAIAASTSAWLAFVDAGCSAVSQAIDLGRAQALLAAERQDESARAELHFLEDEAERLTHAGEEVLAAAAGGPVLSLPD